MHEERSASPPRPAVVPALTIKPPSLPVRVGGFAGQSKSNMTSSMTVAASSTAPPHAAYLGFPASLRMQVDALTDVQRSALLAYLMSSSSKKKFSNSDAAEELHAKGKAPTLSCWQQLTRCLAPPTPQAAPTAHPDLSTDPAPAQQPTASIEGQTPVLPPAVKAALDPAAKVAAPDADGEPPARPPTASTEEEIPVLPPVVQAAYDAAEKAAAMESVLELLDDADADLAPPGARELQRQFTSLPVPTNGALKVLPGLPGSTRPPLQGAGPAPSRSAMPGMPGSIIASAQVEDEV